MAGRGFHQGRNAAADQGALGQFDALKHLGRSQAERILRVSRPEHGVTNAVLNLDTLPCRKRNNDAVTGAEAPRASWHVLPPFPNGTAITALTQGKTVRIFRLSASLNDELLQDEDLASAPLKEPSKRWRNKWRCRFGGPVYRLDRTVLHSHLQAGEAFFDDFVWPSREIAEQRALNEIAAVRDGAIACEYRGAHPFDEES